MKNYIGKISGTVLVAGVLVIALTLGCQREKKQVAEASKASVDADVVSWQYIPGQYIVVYNKAEIGNPQQKIGKNPAALKDYIVAVTDNVLKEQGIGEGAHVQNIYCNTINGFSAQLSDQAVSVLKNDKRVAYVKQDVMITLGRPSPGGGGGPAQTIPWGQIRVNWANYSGNNVIWILDTGIDLDHPDLNVDKNRGFNAMTTGKDARTLDDLNGHGSHCAGIAAAEDNEIGVVGAAAGATVIPVKVLGQTGSGSYSGVIAGVDFVAVNGSAGDVASMSLGGPVYQPLDDAILAAAANGITFVLAAGNEADNANNHSPARTNGPNVYTISAMSQSGAWAGFSNFGNSVDYCAPGVSIFSTYKDGGYATLSGTSMATPHAAGVMLHGAFTTNGTVSGDPDGVADPIIKH